MYKVYETLCLTIEYLGILVNHVNKRVTTLCPWRLKGRVRYLHTLLNPNEPSFKYTATS